jgi:hypothetical protein
LLALHFEDFRKAARAQLLNDIVELGGVLCLDFWLTFQLLPKRFLSGHSVHNLRLAIAFGVVHRDQHVNDILGRLIDVLLGEVKEECVQLIRESLERGFAFLLHNQSHLVNFHVQLVLNHELAISGPRRVAFLQFV